MASEDEFSSETQETPKKNKVQFDSEIFEENGENGSPDVARRITDGEEKLEMEVLQTSVEDYNALIDKIKKYTVLYGLKPQHWENLELSSVIRFFEEPSEEILTFYFDGIILKAELGLPPCPTDLIFYYMKRAGTIVSAKNFNDVVVFGSIDFSSDGWVLKLLKEVYGPYFFSNQRLPNSLKNELCSAVHSFIANITAIHYQKFGITMLYQPHDGQNLSLFEAANDINLIKRWEAIVACWIKQIEIALQEREFGPNEEFSDPLEIYEILCKRLDNLQRIQKQLYLQPVVKMVKVLKQAGSTFYGPLIKLMGFLKISIDYTRKNVTFLKILVEPCKELHGVNCPTEIPHKLPALITKIRTIWFKSSYFRRREKIYLIFRSLSNLVLHLCSKHINLNKLMEGKTRSIMSEIEESRNACLNFKMIVLKLSKALDERSNLKWDLNERILFKDCDSFVGRCSDIIEICQDMIYFARMDESKEIEKPMFGGFSWEKHEKIIEKVEERYESIFEKILIHEDAMLDCRKLEWDKTVLDYRKAVDGIETTVKNLADTVFEDMDCIVKGIEALFSFHNYFEKPSMKPFFLKKFTKILDIFNNELIETMSQVSKKKLKCPKNFPQYAGYALLLNNKMEILKEEYEVLIDTHWIPYNELFITIKENYDAVINMIINQQKELYTKWFSEIDMKFEQRLNRPIIAVSPKNPGKLIANYDRYLTNLFAEIKYWNLIKYKISPALKDFYSIRKEHKIMIKSVTTFTSDYNLLCSVLTDSELILFKELILPIDDKIYPALTSLTWLSPNIEQFITECRNHTVFLKDSIKLYKKANTNLRNICHQIGKFTLFNLEADCHYSYDELQNKQKEFRDDILNEVLLLYKQVPMHLDVVNKIFEGHISKMTKYWTDYLDEIESMFEESFKNLTYLSMDYFINSLIGLEKKYPKLIFKAKLFLDDKRMYLEPSMDYIHEKLISVMQDIVKSLEVIPRLITKYHKIKKLKLPIFVEIETDSQWAQLGTKLITEIEKTLSLIEEYINSLVPFSEMWQVDKDVFMMNYEKADPSLEVMLFDIQRFLEFGANLETISTETTISFLEVDSLGVKEALCAHCKAWQNRFFECLTKMTYKRLKVVDENLDELGQNVEIEAATLEEVEVIRKDLKETMRKIKLLESKFPEINQHFDAMNKYRLPVDPEMKTVLDSLTKKAYQVSIKVVRAEESLDKRTEELQKAVEDEVQKIETEASDLLSEFLKNGPYTSEWEATDSLNFINNVKSKCLDIKEKVSNLRGDLEKFHIIPPTLAELETIDKEINILELVWEVILETDQTWRKQTSKPFRDLKGDDFESKVNTSYRKIVRLHRELKEKQWQILDWMKERVSKMKHNLPVIQALVNPCLRDRHWINIKAIVQIDFDQNSVEFSVDSIEEYKLIKFYDQISDVSNSATFEMNIELGLKSIRTSWGDINLKTEPHKTDGIFKLKEIDEIFNSIEENQVSLAAMKSTRFVEPFIKEVKYWEKTLSMMATVLEMILNFQRQYFYLENIFLGEDISKQLPEETGKFYLISKGWEKITAKINEEKNALKCLTAEGLLENVSFMNVQLELIQKALEDYLEVKRRNFPRFYFISNDDLLDMLGNSKNPEAIQPHLKKCFDNLHRLKLKSDAMEALGMYSADGEYVEFITPVPLKGNVESWLNLIVLSMRETIKYLLKQCSTALRKYLTKRDKWVKEWPGQVCICVSQIQWTLDCTRNLHICKIQETRKPLKHLRKKQDKILSKFSEAVRGDLTKLQRLKIVSLVTIEIHARDVIDKLYKTSCKDVSAFEWLSQLRFSWDKDLDSCVVRQTKSCFVYGYEYLGNSGRLAITPLTDRCYITLTTALHLHRGGCPKGPAGTGKTETVKDLGKSLGYYVIVINCSEGLDYKSMGHMFSGLAQTGAWGCFDEFNRINVEVLSVVAQQILAILQALARHQASFVFESQQINLVDTCGIFITMNPGYAGRTELPDNLKTMFRPVSMVVPDSCLIAEIILFGEGFKETRALAKKVYTLYCLAMQQLSKQDHYDFGLRGMVALLRYAGRKRRLFPTFSDNEIILLAMKDMNLAKLTSNDLPLFSGIISDLFPNVNIPVIDYEELSIAVVEELKQNGYQPLPTAVTKVIQLYETKTSRHSVMLLGRTGSGKSVTWKTLKLALIRLHNENIPGYYYVKEHPINPKALSLGELYGEFNLITGEWLDGVLSALMRKACSDESPNEKWILFDGPVDAVWIENMNSVMDDNKVLTLINSERIALPDQVSLLFEVDDLSEASPATVSRCGMVYFDYKDLGWRAYVSSWLHRNTDEEYVNEIQRFVDRYISNILEFKRLNCKEIIPLTDIAVITSLCNLLHCFSTRENGMDTSQGDLFKPIAKKWFLFCVVWSICAAVDEESRKKIDAYIRELEGTYPLKDTVYEYFIDPVTRSFLNWETKLKENLKIELNSPFYKIVVPTVDTLRYQYIITSLLKAGLPVLLVGSSGTGKTSIAQGSLDSLDSDVYSFLTVNMSAQTSSNGLQELVCSKLDKRSKGVYYPVLGNKLVTFMDDLNMPAKEIYGAQPPLELIRQWFDYGFWYDRQKQTPIYIKDMLLMAAMGPPGGGRNMISRRLLNCFNVLNVAFPTISEIERIFGTMLRCKMNDFDDDVKPLSTLITDATISLYLAVVENLLPSPKKIHYLFSLRDISKVFQGLLRGQADLQTTKNSFLRLWIHECYRVFYDRLIDDNDREWFENQMNNHLGEHFDITLNGLCPGKVIPIFGDFANDQRVYQDFVDFASLKKNMEKLLKEYNTCPGVIKMDLVLFRDAIEHISRIIRVISQPRGNMLLIGNGGSGRKSLSRLSTFICEYEFFQIEIRKQYRVQEFCEDLKILYRGTGVEKKETTFFFSDSQVTDERFLEIINNILSSGEVPNLYKSEELEEIKNTLQASAADGKIFQTSAAAFDFFIESVRQHLHVVLCMSPSGSAFRNWIRQYPGLVNCSTLDWYRRWPEDALLEVANVNLSKVKLSTSEEQSEEMLRGSIATIFASMHHSVHSYSARMLSEIKRPNYVSPTNYLQLVSGYIDFLQTKRKELSDSADKLRSGLLKIDETRAKIEVMSAELADAQVKVANFQQECDNYLVIIAQQKREADEQQKSVTVKSKKIMQEEAACKKLADIAQTDLDEAMPALEEAMRALDALNKKDLSEIKSYGRPPAKVEMVMEAVMILKMVEPTWAEAKRQLGDPNFLTQLRDFDKDNISDKTLKKIALYTTNEEFEPEKVGIVSIAAKSLCMWVRAIEKYGKIYRVVAPKRAKLKEATDNLKEKQAALMEAQNKLDELSETLNRLKKDFDEKLANKEELRKKAEELQEKLDRASLLVSGLSDEKERWSQTVKFLDERYKYLPGDCLITTAFIAYLGPFVSVYREELLRSWRANVKKLNVPHSSDFNIISFLEDPSTIREWQLQGLPPDDFSIENAVIATRANRWPLIIDPQSQAIKWIQAMENSKGNLRIIDLQQQNFMKVLEEAIQQGTSVLLKNVEEWIDPSLQPILSKSFITQGGLCLIKLDERMVEYNENFHLYIATKMQNPHYTPEISTKTTVINFAVKEKGLEAQLLSIVVGKERPDLEEEKDSLVTNIAAGKKLLKNLEDEILRILNETEGSLLDDVHLVNTLKSSKATSVSVKEQLEISEKTEIEIDSARELYRPCAERASILFFALNDLSHIDPMYQFSLDSYINLFINSICKSDKKSNLEERIQSLNDYHTYAVYRNTCRGLFERHKLLFSFHMAVKIMDAQGEVISGEYWFLLRGGVVLHREAQTDNPCSAWLSEDSWDNVSELDKLPGFHGLISSFEENAQEWHQWYIANEPENTPLVEHWEETCSEFQRMLLVRSLRPDRISFCITKYITNKLGSQFVEPPVLDLHSVLDDSNAFSPLIFILSPGIDPSMTLLQLAESVGMEKRMRMLSLGQGQASVARSLIHNGLKEGEWVYLANCHLSMSWMPELDKIVEQLPQEPINKMFRLWLSSSPKPDFPISILQSATKMTTEPPKGIKANMKRLYQIVTDQQFESCTRPEKYKKLLFSLCFFHSLLLERKKFHQLGWNVSYSFNDSDFEISENLLSLFLSEYEDTPWDALKYLIAGINYGGHVTDEWDRRLLNTYVDYFFKDEAINTQFYRLSSLPIYYIPRDGTLQSYRDYIVILPNVDSAEVFGQHPNADITSLISETRGLFETLLSLQVQAADSASLSQEDKVVELCNEVLLKLPEEIDYEACDRLTGSNKSPLDVVLLQEISCYNLLIKTIKWSLVELQKGIKGLVVMSSELEEIYNSINDGRVPNEWLKAYPSLKFLGSWAQDLVQRVDYFSQWAVTLKVPILFWLGAFTFPSGLLTAVLQTSARQEGISVDTLTWDFTVVFQDETLISEGPDEGIYVHCLHLEGAGWDWKNACLTDPLPMQLISSMPVIHFKSVDQHKKKQRGIYICPTYYYPNRTGEGTRPSFVIAVELKSGSKPSDYWIKRGTAMLLSLS